MAETAHIEPEYLTPAGRKWAERNAMTSMCANVALHGAGVWPEAHYAAAIKVANEEGARK